MLQLQVKAIKWEAADTATYFLQEVSGRQIFYLPGQFITLVFDHHNEEIRRSYSISSVPDDDLLAITVKRVANGELSRFIITHTKVGDIWTAVEPAGRFVLTDADKPIDIFFFAAGSGITPIYPQIKSALNTLGKSRLHPIYSNRNEQNILFKDELDELQRQHSNRLNITYLLSDDARRLNNVMAEQLVISQAQFDLKQSQFYLCGPFDYMRMVKMTLIYMGLSNAQIRKENFVLDTVKVADLKTNYPPGKIRIHYGGEVFDITTGENQSILQAALQNHIQLPYSCRTGICSACTAKCTKGKVIMIENQVLTDKDIAEGLVLTCTGYARGNDVVIEF